MCVIIVCPKGVELPSKKILEQAKYINRHGYGFVSESDYFRSMDFNEFYRRLKKVDKEENVIIHLRYATHGSKKLENCHPFYNDGLYFAHNGILDIEPIGDMTDSETAFRTCIKDAVEKYGYGSREFFSYCDYLAGGSKFAFMLNGEIMLIGHYYEIDGVYYSNLRFLNYDNRFNVVNMCYQ